jgi:transposase
MNIDWARVRVYVRPGPTDMRKQMHTLSVYVAEELRHDALSSDLYVFCSRDRRLIKVLYWDRNGFCLWQKRLEKDRFPWPRDEREVLTITREEFGMILAGIDFFHAHKTLHYSSVS